MKILYKMTANIILAIATILIIIHCKINKLYLCFKRKYDGIDIVCKKCHKKYKVLLNEIYEDEYEEPYGGFSMYLVTRCPHCLQEFEPDSEIYKLFYKK